MSRGGGLNGLLEVGSWNGTSIADAYIQIICQWYSKNQQSSWTDRSLGGRTHAVRPMTAEQLAKGGKGRERIILGGFEYDESQMRVMIDDA